MANKNNIFTILLASAAFALSLAACGSKPAKLSPADETLANEQGIDKDALLELRKYTDSTLTTAIAENLDVNLCFKDSVAYGTFQKKNVRGLQFYADKDNAASIVSTLGESFRKKGLYIYVSDMNFGYKPEKITILKTDDKFDLLRFEGTNGVNYSIFVEDIIEKLTAWDKSMHMEFKAVGPDFAEAGIGQLPADLRAFSQELYKFCPDIVDQGTGSVSALQDDIKKTQSLYLWWD